MNPRNQYHVTRGDRKQFLAELAVKVQEHRQHLPDAEPLERRARFAAIKKLELIISRQTETSLRGMQ